ncbi:MAG: hypothetical protein DMD64_00060 [Gemmatimonadetes bacterium]|nr:MAG: hypothetical protein DMD64_00060 [Gemmatimonadota bacterium]
MPQVEEEVGTGGRVQVQGTLRHVGGHGPTVHGAECQRVREAKGLEACLEGGDALAGVSTAPAAPRRRRVVAVIQVEGLEPDHPATEGLEAKGPVEINPQVTAPIRVGHGVGGR